MDKLKQELNSLIDQYGTLDNRTIAKSQELDVLVNKEMRLTMKYRVRPYSLAWLIKNIAKDILGGLVGAALVVLILCFVCLIGGQV